jgi:hypothetical protein
MKFLPVLSLLALSALTGYGNEEGPSSTPSPSPPPVNIYNYNYIYPVQPAPVAPAPTPPPPVIVPTPSVEVEVAQFVISFINSGSGSPYNEAAYYADYNVAYFDKGFVNRAFIATDIASYDTRWPIRLYQITEGPEIYWVNDRTAEAVLVASFSVSNSRKTVNGSFKESVLVRVDTWKVIGVVSQVVQKATRY